MTQTEQLTNNVVIRELNPETNHFYPGDLAHGLLADLATWNYLVSQGVKPAADIDNNHRLRVTIAVTPDVISLSLLSKEPDRYFTADHSGPKEPSIVSSESIKLGIIISGIKLRQMFPGRIFAVGKDFIRAERDKRYEVIQEGPLEFVYGIPIFSGLAPSGNLPFYPRGDEVRLTVFEKETPRSIMPSLWQALVTPVDSLPILLNWLEGTTLNTIPIFYISEKVRGADRYRFRLE